MAKKKLEEPEAIEEPKAESQKPKKLKAKGKLKKQEHNRHGKRCTKPPLPSKGYRIFP